MTGSFVVSAVPSPAVRGRRHDLSSLPGMGQPDRGHPGDSLTARRIGGASDEGPPVTVASHSANRYLDRPAPSSLADVIDTILDKGLVIDVYVRVSLVGIEILTIDARIVIASVDTYLRFAQAVNRLDLTETQADLLDELTD
jgi:hypothetical protein